MPLNQPGAAAGQVEVLVVAVELVVQEMVCKAWMAALAAALLFTGEEVVVVRGQLVQQEQAPLVEPVVEGKHLIFPAQ